MQSWPSDFDISDQRLCGEKVALLDAENIAFLLQNLIKAAVILIH